MSVRVAFRDETAFGESLQHGALELADRELAVADLLRLRIEADGVAFARAVDEPYRGLVQPLHVDEQDDEVVLSTPEPDTSVLLAVALEALEAGHLSLDYAGRPLTARDSIRPRPGEAITFVKRVPLLARS